MKGTEIQLEKITEQLHDVLLNTKEPLKSQAFDLKFSQLACQALLIADIIISHSDAEYKAVCSFKKMVGKFKQAHKSRPLYDEQDSQQELSMPNSGELAKILKKSENGPDDTERADLDWFVNKMETKHQDTMNFIDSVSLLKNKNAMKKRALHSWELSNRQTQTDLIWVNHLDIQSETARQTIDSLVNNLKANSNFSKQVQDIFGLKSSKNQLIEAQNKINTQQQTNTMISEHYDGEMIINYPVQAETGKDTAKQKTNKKKENIKNQRMSARQSKLKNQKDIQQSKYSIQKQKTQTNHNKNQISKMRFQGKKKTVQKGQGQNDEQFDRKQCINEQNEQKANKLQTLAEKQNTKNFQEKQVKNKQTSNDNQANKIDNSITLISNDHEYPTKYTEKTNSISLQHQQHQNYSNKTPKKSNTNLHKQNICIQKVNKVNHNIELKRVYQQKLQKIDRRESNQQQKIKYTRNGILTNQQKQNNLKNSAIQNIKDNSSSLQHKKASKRELRQILTDSCNIDKSSSYYLSQADLQLYKDKNQSNGFSTHRKPFNQSSQCQQLPSIYKQAVQDSKIIFTPEELELQRKVSKLMQTNPAAALAMLEQQDQETLKKLKDLVIQKGSNNPKINDCMQKIQYLHRRVCGTDCIHLKRFYKYLKNNRSNKRIPMAMATRKIGFFS